MFTCYARASSSLLAAANSLGPNHGPPEDHGSQRSGARWMLASRLQVWVGLLQPNHEVEGTRGANENQGPSNYEAIYEPLLLARVGCQEAVCVLRWRVRQGYQLMEGHLELLRASRT